MTTRQHLAGKIREGLRNRVRAFLRSDRRNEWIVVHGCRVYVRQSMRDLQAQTKRPFELISCLDIAAIEIPERLRRNGIFSWLLEDVAAMLSTVELSEGYLRRHFPVAIYLENVLSDSLREMILVRHKYVPHYRLDRCLWKAITR